MKITQRHHDEAEARVKAVHPKAELHAHGIWRRTLTVGGGSYDKEEYIHIYRTPVPDRYLIHLCDRPDKPHVSWESGASLAEILEEVDVKGNG